MAEHSAVNRRVVGSSPTCGAKKSKRRGGWAASPFCFYVARMFWAFVTELSIFSVSDEDLVNPFGSELLHFNNRGLKFSFNGR